MVTCGQGEGAGERSSRGPWEPLAVMGLFIFLVVVMVSWVDAYVKT